MTTCDGSDDESGASVFNCRGQRVNEIDLDTRRHPQTIAEMSDEDWQAAAAIVREFDARQR